jgi:hypothetical protein
MSSARDPDHPEALLVVFNKVLSARALGTNRQMYSCTALTQL